MYIKNNVTQCILIPDKLERVNAACTKRVRSRCKWNGIIEKRCTILELPANSWSNSEYLF